MTRPYTRDEWRNVLTSAQRGDPIYLEELQRVNATLEHGFLKPSVDEAGHAFARVAQEVVAEMTGETQRLRRESIQAGDTIWQRHKLDEGRIGKVTPVLVAARKGGVIRLKTLDDPGSGDWFALEDLRIYHVERPE